MLRHELIAEDHDILLLRTEAGGGRVVAVDRDRHQVYSVVPRDHPAGGRWFAGFTDAGVEYVSSVRSLATARRWWRRLVAEARWLEACQ